MGNWYIPSIKIRKLQAGKPCPACSLLMHHGDMVAWSGEEGTAFLHDKCAEIVIDTINQGVIHYTEGAGNDESPPEEEAEGDSSEAS